MTPSPGDSAKTEQHQGGVDGGAPLSRGRPGVAKMRVRRPRPPFDDTDLFIFGAKTCTKCGAALPANEEQFGRDKYEVDGLTLRCRDCKNLRERTGHEARRVRG